MSTISLREEFFLKVVIIDMVQERLRKIDLDDL
jgi:hypothetical protein